MKRPPGLWLLLSAGVLWLSVQNVYGVKATSLIFGKQSTTPSSSEASAEEGANGDPEAVDGAVTTTESANSTKPTNLTGIPQIDYVWDPNLPRELNGYNLTEYPFYDRVPEDIDFKCDGLHDGFYASVPHKCQVYHHCLFGTRYDFLCANYTAFDQKTFICHFVSEVDCVNSKKFWHRNDALYKAASTTTVKPAFVYTPPAQPPPFFANSAPSASNPQPQPAAPEAAPPARRPNGGARQRPSRPRPRRPQYDYYDDYEDYYEADYYEEPRPRGRRKRPRPRPRPLYDDEYDEEYEVGARRRRPGRRPYRGYDDRRPMRRRKNGDRRPYDDLDEEYEDEAPRFNRKKNRNEDDSRPAKKNDRRQDDEDYERPRKTHRRPADDYEDDKPLKEERRPFDRRRADDEAPLIKPSSGSSIYNRPRAAPKVRPPVPKNEQEKFAYKPMSTTELPPPKDVADEEYYEEYEEEVPAKRATAKKPEPSEPRRPLFKPPAGRDESKETMPSRPRGYTPKHPIEEEEEEETERPNFRRPFKRPKYGSDHDGRFGSSNRKRPPADEYYDDYEDVPVKSKKGKGVAEEDATTTTTTTAAPATPRERPEGIVRVVKRPFLPSRGGNPYAPRGLQPIGAKAVENEKLDDEVVVKREEEEEVPLEEELEEELEQQELLQEVAEPSTTAAPPRQTEPTVKPVVLKVNVNVRPKTSTAPPPPTTEEAIARPSSTKLPPFKTLLKSDQRPLTTEKPKPPEPNPLDINENEYDVTLNEALNPTLPNLPVRSFPTGFSSGDYAFRSLHRNGPRYVVDTGLDQEGSDLAFQLKPSGQRQIYNSGGGAQFVNANSDYAGQFSQQVPSYRPSPRLTQAHVRGFHQS